MFCLKTVKQRYTVSERFLAWLVAKLIEYRLGCVPSFLPSFLHLLVFALKPYFSQDFRVIIIFLVSFDALLNLTPPLEARLALYCLIFLILIFKH